MLGSASTKIKLDRGYSVQSAQTNYQVRGSDSPLKPNTRAGQYEIYVIL